MRVLPWRPRLSQTQTVALSSARVPGAYAGRATFRPRRPEALPLSLRPVIGRIVEVGYAGIAPAGDRFAGQALYLEWRKDEVFDGFLIPEEDLQFVRTGTDQLASSLSANLHRD
jgi:hypothetical protein